MNLLEGAKGFAGNEPLDWMVALGIVVAVTALFFVVKRVVVHRLAKYAARTANKADDLMIDILGRTKLWFALAVATYLGSLHLELPALATRALRTLLVVALFMQLAVWANRGIATWLRHHLTEKSDSDPASAPTVRLFGFLARVMLWSVTLLVILDNLGINITALLTGLGIGGVAVALALQNILGDVIASLSIVLDKPFTIGDFVVIGEHLGTVEHIGLKTTRIRSLAGEQIVFANADLLKSVIRNYQRMYERRVQFQFGVTYQTPYEKLARIPAMVREIIEAQPKARFDRAHFKAYGDSSLNFEVVFYVRDQDYNVSMDVQQAINFALFRRFAEEGIEFAYPTRTLFITHTGQQLPEEVGSRHG